MTPLKTPQMQAAFDHAVTAAQMLDQILADKGLDAEGLAARSHLIEATAALDRSLAREVGQREMGL